MYKRFAFISSLFLFVFSTANAYVFSQPEKDFNNQVMNIMQDIENKSIAQKDIDQYLNHVNVDNNIKQAVKSNVEKNIRYSNFHKIADGTYACNKTNNKVNYQKNAKCVNINTDFGPSYGCAYSPNSTCTSYGYTCFTG